MKDTTRQSVNSVLKWILLLLAFHLVFSILFYELVMTNHINDLIKNNYPDIAVRKVVIFDVILLLLFCLYDGLSRTREVAFSMELKSAMKEKDFSLLPYFFKTQTKFNLVRVAIFAVFQIPYAIFAAIFQGYPEILLNMMAFWRVEAGFYLAGGSAILGLLISTALFALFLFATHFFWYFFSRYRILKNAPRGMYDKSE